jgi:hypothetical protein
MGLFWIAVVIVFGGMTIIRLIAPGENSSIYVDLILLIAIPWLITSCIFMIIRKEAPRPGLTSVKGKWAVIQGAVGLVILTYVEVKEICLFLIELGAK